MRNSRLNRHGWIAVVFLAACLFCMAWAGVSAADELDQEFQFASGLIGLGFSDYADKVVQKVLLEHPDQKDRAKLIQAEVLISRRKFGDAEGFVKEMGADNPKAQAIRLALGKGYYVAGEMDKAKQLYNDFFKQYEGKIPTDPDLLRFYQDSAFQYAQMLEMAGDKAGAVKAYGYILASKPDKNVARRIQARQAQMEVELAQSAPFDQRETYLADAKKLCDAIQWGGLDLWFGQTIITLANIEMVRGNRPQAQKVILSNLDILKEIDKFIVDEGLPMAESPMAGARFLLGQLFIQDAQEAAKQKKNDAAIQAYAKALTEFYNVFAKYGDSEWGPQAGVKAQELKSLLQTQYGKKVNVDLGAFQAKAAESQFKLARNLYLQKQYKAAIDEYLRNLNQFPETEASPPALASLALSYANLDDKLMVKAVVGYTAERFAGKDPAAVSLMLVGKYYFDKKDELMYNCVYSNYLRCFPKHERAAAILFTLANIRKQTNDLAGAEAYYQRIVQDYPNDQYYPKALSQLAWSRFLSTNFQGAVQDFPKYLAVSQPGTEKAQAQFAFAESYRQLGNLTNALSAYETLIAWLAPKNNPFSTTPADAKKNAEVLERAVFQRANCCARIKAAPEAQAQYRQTAIKAFDQFIELFPQSTLAPKALNGRGTVQLEINQFDAAAKTFDELAAKYPQSDEGKSALFALVRSAMEIKKYDQAKSAFEKMLNAGGSYSPDQFARIGQMMLDAKMYPEAVDGFWRAVNSKTEDRTVLEVSYYGLGRAYNEQKNYPRAIEALEELMARYPKSGLFYDAKFTLGGAYRAVGNMSNAVAVLSDVFRYADKAVLINKASFELAKIQQEQKQNDAALASFLRVGLLGDPNDAELRPLIEESLVEAAKLSFELRKYQDVMDTCDEYMNKFPTGAHIDLMRQLKADAKVKAASRSAPPPPAAAPAAPAAK